ncbi:MAG: hypothetical protein OHK006_08740 [Thermodesulfovibrionales bacterium]
MLKLLKVVIVLVVLAALAVIGHDPLLTRAGKYLVKKDALKPADAIVVLAGEQTERTEYGVRLFREGWARKDRIIMAGGPLVWKYTWAGLMKEHAMNLGVPGRNILTEEFSRSTEEDALYTKELLKAHGFRSIILVTSPYHSKRASLIFRRVMGSEITVINAPVEGGWFSLKEWWARPRDRSMVLNEYSKFLWLLLFGYQEAKPVS